MNDWPGIHVKQTIVNCSEMTVYELLYGALFKMEEFNTSLWVIKAHRMNFIAGNYKLGDSQYRVLRFKRR